MKDWSQIISAGVGPIIVISACGLLCLALYNRLAAVVTRLRTFHRERMTSQAALDGLTRNKSAADHEVVRQQEILGMLQVQCNRVIQRARLIRKALQSLLLAIVCLALCSLALGLSVITRALLYLAVPLFVLGLLTLVAGVMFALAEVRHSLDPIELEGRFLADMNTDQAEP